MRRTRRRTHPDRLRIESPTSRGRPARPGRGTPEASRRRSILAPPRSCRSTGIPMAGSPRSCFAASTTRIAGSWPSIRRRSSRPPSRTTRTSRARARSGRPPNATPSGPSTTCTIRAGSTGRSTRWIGRGTVPGSGSSARPRAGRTSWRGNPARMPRPDSSPASSRSGTCGNTPPTARSSTGATVAIRACGGSSVSSRPRTGSSRWLPSRAGRGRRWRNRPAWSSGMRSAPMVHGSPSSPRRWTARPSSSRWT